MSSNSNSVVALRFFPSVEREKFLVSSEVIVILHKVSSIIDLTAVWRVMFGLINLMRPIDASRCVENLLYFNHILLVLSKGKIVLSSLVEYRNCLYGIAVSILQQMYALTELNFWLWIVASVKALR